jgi:hypothetical protein
LNAIELFAAKESFAADLRSCGIEELDVQALRRRYARALAGGSYADWIELYVGVFATLNRSLHSARAVKTAAAERLRRLIDDDLGARLFDADARAHLAESTASRRARAS